MFSQRTNWLLPTTLAVAVASVSVQADPVPDPKIPVVYCLRVTDIEATADPNRFKFMFQPLNWADEKAYGLFMSVNKAGVGQPGGRAFFVENAATVDENGRPFGMDDDDANFQPNDGTITLPSPKIPGPINNWVQESNTKTHVEYRGDYGIPYRDLLNGGKPTTVGACNLVPGCSVVNGDPIIANPETIDNGWPASTDNVLDGLVLEIDNLTPGKFFSFNWFLLDQSGSPIGSLGFGNEFGFGTFNIYRAKNGDIFPLELPWGAIYNVGVSQSLRYAFKSATSSGIEFGFEAGAAITTRFLNRDDNPGVKDDTPLAVEVVDVKATVDNGDISLTWSVGSVSDRVDFLVWRAIENNGEYTLDVFNQIESDGANYSFTDVITGSDVNHYYLLEGIEENDSTFYCDDLVGITLPSGIAVSSDKLDVARDYCKQVTGSEN